MEPLYKDPNAPIEERVKDLLPRMTLEEKISEMRLYQKPYFMYPDGKFDPEIFEAHRYEGNSVYTTDDAAPAEFINAMQDYCLHETRLGIPAAVHGESLHGSMTPDSTVFPNPIAFAATFDDALIEKTAQTIGEEVRAHGITQTYAPNLDLSQDPRWGRVEENYGEDPYLTARMGVAYIKGLQSQGIASSPKHYAAHGAPQGGLNQATVHCGERELRETYLYPFKKAFTEGGALSVMPAYSEIDGIPAHMSEFLLTKVLREEWGFQGTAVSDWNGLARLHFLHAIAETPEEAGELGLRAGIDMEAPSIYGFSDRFFELVREGKIPMELVDRAVSRILWLKFKLGLFEHPYAVSDRSGICRTKEHLALAQKVEEEAAVLLKNEGDILPLQKNIGKVAVIGPNADIMQLGDYVLKDATARTKTVYAALSERLGEERVLYARGSNIGFGTEEMLDEAEMAAKAADVAIVVLGDNSSYYANEYWSDGEDPAVRRATVTCGETFDVTDLDLPAAQETLLERVTATGTPVILVMQSGRAHSINFAAEHAAAILEAWYAGESGADAIVNILFGDVNPSGRLPWTVPRCVGQVPCYYNHKYSCGMRGDRKEGAPDRAGHSYVFQTPEPLYPFGFGLSYTTFEYRDLTVSKGEIAPTESPAAPVCEISPDDTVTVSVKVKNTGERAGRESVLMYLHDLYCRVTSPVKKLRGFKKVSLEPGEEKTVTFTLGREDYEYIGLDMKPAVDPGTFEIYVGPLTASFRIV